MSLVVVDDSGLETVLNLIQLLHAVLVLEHRCIAARVLIYTVESNDSLAIFLVKIRERNVVWLFAGADIIIV